MPKMYLAKVVDQKKRFKLVSPKALRLDSTVEHEGTTYRVLYNYKIGRDCVVVLKTIKAKRGRPRANPKK